MKKEFTKEQEAFLKKIGINFSVKKKLDEDHIAELDMVVTDYLIEHGINEDESVNEIGMMCEEILKIIEELS